MILIVDASVAVKWGVTEEGTERAMLLLGRAPIIAPDLVVAEVANALWRKELRGELASAQRLPSLAACLSGYEEFVPATVFADRALDLANTLKHPVYDCFYLALAELRDGTFITADARLLSRLGAGGWGGKVEAL